MKKFEMPSIEVSTFAAEDIMTLSSGGENETPGLPGGIGG